MFSKGGGTSSSRMSSLLLASKRSDRKQPPPPSSPSAYTTTPGAQYNDNNYFSSANQQFKTKEEEFLGMNRLPKQRSGGNQKGEQHAGAPKAESRGFFAGQEVLLNDTLRSQMKDTTDNVNRMTASRPSQYLGSLAMRTCMPRQKLILSQHIPQHIKAKLPMNLLLFDGQCPFCAQQVQNVLFRNFTYSVFDDEDNVDSLRDKRIYFASLQKDGRELRKLVQNQLELPYSTSALTLDKVVREGLGVTPEVLADTDATMFIFLERVPSKLSEANAKRHARGAMTGLKDTNVNSGGGSGVDPSYDLMVSTQGYAAARVMMKLDRLTTRLGGFALNHLVPRTFHSFMFQRYHQKRHFDYLPMKGVASANGDNDVTVAGNVKAVQGLQSRLWSMKNGAGAGSITNDQYKLFDTDADWEQIAKNRKR